MSRKRKGLKHTQVNAPLAYITALDVLLTARSLAQSTKDHHALIDIANSYIEIGNQMLTHEVQLDYDEDEEEPTTVQTGSPTDYPIGFTQGGGYDRAEEEVDPGTVTEPDRH